MHAFIGATLLTSKEAQPQEKPFEISDCRLSGFMLRIQPSGVRTYYARFGRNRRVVLGKAGTIAPEEARERCQKVLGNVAHGCHPLHGISGTEGITLGMFIADTYTTWVNASRPRTAANTLEKLHRHFRTWYPESLTAITVERIESWKARRLSEGRSPVTVLRDLFALSSVLRRAVKAGELLENPMRRVDKPRIDRRGKVRFLDEVEESRLRTVLMERDEQMKKLRTAANAQRQKRRKPLLSPLAHFGDHLTAAVLLSMNTGLRRGEVLKLHWVSVDFTRRLLTVEGRNAKSRQTRHVPLNDEATSVLRRWREQSGNSGRVFDATTGFRTAWGKGPQARSHQQIPLARSAPSLCLAAGSARRPAEHRTGPAGSQLGADVAALRTPGTRPAARGRGQAQPKARSCAYPALTVERPGDSARLSH
jgi:integrase